MSISIDCKRNFVAEDLKINRWEDVQPYFDQLLAEEINSVGAFKAWLQKKSELDAILEEDLAWRYIKMTIDTNDESKAKAYQQFVAEIQPKLAPMDHKLNQKILDCAFKEDLKKESQGYFIFFRGLEKAVEIFRDENVPIQAELDEMSQQFGVISGNQSIEVKGEEVTMQKASTFLKSTDRALRQEVFEAMGERRLQDQDQLEDLFDELLKRRHQVALNAGFENYRDYMFAALGRFDYTPQDCYDFHEAVAQSIVPIVDQISRERKEKLGLEQLRPFDTSVDVEGKEPLKPFESGAEMLKGTQQLFGQLDPYFQECLEKMEEIQHLDLESKKGKAPGGYNYPLFETGVPFIFMNAVGAHRDLITMVHEGGHAVHSFLTKDLEMTAFKSFPSEVAELASMSMEMFSMDYWNTFYNEEELVRAKKEQLETVLQILPWVATVDEFQHWLYTHPNHTREERKAAWIKVLSRYSGDTVDWSGYEDIKAYSWHRQLHIFEVPFYYIEYGMAQLGALALWKNFEKNPEETLKAYKAALSLGYTQTIPEIYKAAGIAFDFSLENIKSVAAFVGEALKKLDGDAQ